MTGNSTKAEREALFERTREALNAFGQGRMIIVYDHEKRENEGDFIVAADAVTPEHINFMAKHGRGLICVAMERNQLSKLGLSRMTTDGRGDPYKTAFMESVDAREGITTGISAYDRARTVQVLIDENSGPGDILRPGHVFPLEAMTDGVLRRGGHTEAAVDIARLSGRKAAGVICEILREDGQMARAAELRTMARDHGLPMLSIDDLIAYRKRTEKLVRLEKEARFPTEYAMFQLKMYHAIPENEHHLALVMGQPEQEDAALVRVHSECLTGDVLGSLRCDCGGQLKSAMQQIANKGHGVLLYMRQEGRGIGLQYKIHAYALQDDGLDTVEANTELGFDADERDYCSAAQILEDLGLHRVRLMTNNPHKIEGLEEYGMEVAERVPIIMTATPYNARYLETKQRKMRHVFE